MIQILIHGLINDLKILFQYHDYNVCYNLYPNQSFPIYYMHCFYDIYYTRNNQDNLKVLLIESFRLSLHQCHKFLIQYI